MPRSSLGFPSFGNDRLELFSRNRVRPMKFAIHLQERADEIKALVTALGGDVVSLGESPDVVIVEDDACISKPVESYPEDIIVTQQFIGDCIKDNCVVGMDKF
ncbi:unnamed protein product, partial [Allacma fusca]